MQLGVGIVGCGWAAEWHVRDGFARLPDRFSLEACCDVDGERARAFAAKHAIGTVARDFDALVATPGVDVVVICTPAALHREMIVAALRCDKHVICEKPLAGALADIDRIAAAQATSHGRAMPVFQYRFGDGVARVRHAIRAGVAGRHHMSIVESAKRRGADYYAAPHRGTFGSELGGVLVTQAIHVHDLLTWLVGPVAEVACMKTTRVNAIEVEDCAVVSLRFEDGALGSLFATLGAVRQSTRIRLYFENATFEIERFDAAARSISIEPWSVVPKDRDAAAAIAAKMAELPAQRGWFEAQFAAFHDAIRSGGPLPVTLDDARDSIALITAMFESEARGAVVQLPIQREDPAYTGWSRTGG